MRNSISSFVAALAALSFAAGTAEACPFCSAVQVTFTEEIKTNDVAVIAALVERPKPTDGAGDPASELELLKAKFKVTDVLKGDKHTKKGDTLLALYIGEAPIGKEFLVMGIEPPKVEWGAPIEISDSAKSYLHNLMKLPATGPERLEFFQNHLEEKDALISRDAYDEFATTPYAELKKLKSKMKHDEFVKRLADPKTDISHRRLYLTMLGVCGSRSDLPFLEKMLKADDRAMKAGLDALVGCYLNLKGAGGLPLVEELFIKNEKAEFTDQYQAIMALRFHAEEGGVIEKDKIAAVLRHMLDRPKYADLVVPDLARWEDWSVIDRMFALFRDADQDSLWVREPIVNYMRACPLPKAKDYLKQFEKIDPKAVKRASGFFPIAPVKTTPAPEKTGAAIQRTPSKAAGGPTGSPAAGGFVAFADSGAASAVEPRDADAAAAATKLRASEAAIERAAAPTSPMDASAVAQPESQAQSGDAPNRFLLAGAPIVVGLCVATVVFALSGGTNSGRKT